MFGQPDAFGNRGRGGCVGGAMTGWDTAPAGPFGPMRSRERTLEYPMNSIFYIIGVVVVVLAVLSLIGLA